MVYYRCIVTTSNNGFVHVDLSVCEDTTNALKPDIFDLIKEDKHDEA